MDGERPSETPPHDSPPSPSEEYVATGGHVEDETTVHDEEEEAGETRRPSAASRSPPVLSLPEEEDLHERNETDSQDGATGSTRDGSDSSSAPGPNDTTVVLSESEDEEEVVERANTRTRRLPGGRIVPGSCRTRRSHQLCWLCRRDVPNALAEAHFSRHLTESGHSNCPVCDTMFRRDRTSMNRHVRGHFLPYRHRCHRCGSKSQTRVRNRTVTGHCAIC